MSDRSQEGSSATRILPLVVVAALLAAAAGAQRPDAHFRRGVQAIDRGEWAIAEQELRHAIQLDGREKARKVTITGMRYESYLPHYFLGLALLRQNELEGARAAWQRSREHGVIQGWRDAALFERQWSQLVAKIGPPPRSKSTPPIAEALPRAPEPESPARRLAKAKEALEAVIRSAGPPKTPLVAPLLESAGALAEAEEVVRTNSVDHAALERTALRLERAKAQLEKARRPRSTQERIDDLRALVEEVRPEASGELETLVVEADIELARNAPDLERLASIEADLLRRRHPELADLP